MKRRYTMAGKYGNRCNCYNRHESASGRCHHTIYGEEKYCEDCVADCGRVQPKGVSSDYLPKSTDEALQVLCDTKMRPFDKVDAEIFSGAESSNPLIGENGAMTVTVIVDGSRIVFVNKMSESVEFELGAPYK
jgi:hypothetical protein